MGGPVHHKLDVYGAELHLATDRRQWATLRRKLDFLDRAAPGSAGLSQFVTWHPKGRGLTVPHLVLWFDRAAHRTTSEVIDTIAHEASHAAGQLLHWTGHEPKGTDEPHAYLVGWLAAWLWDSIAWAEPT